MTTPSPGAGAPREARILELEQRLFGRPEPGGAGSAGTPAEVEADLAELRRLRAAPPKVEQAGEPESPVPPDAPAASDDPVLDLDPAPIAQSPSVAAPLPTRSRGPARARRVLLGAGLAAIAAGVVAGLVLAPPSPAALDAFDRAASPLERARTEVLRDAGLPLLTEGRIVADAATATLVTFRAPPGTAERLQDADASLVGTELSPFGGAIYLLPDPSAGDRALLRRSEVCAWVVDGTFAIEGRCTPLAEFAESGLVFETERFGIRYAVDWAPTGEAELRTLPFAPTPP